MPAPRRNRWAEWRDVTGQRADAARQGLYDWWRAIRAEPELIWQTVAVRYAVYIMGGLIVLVLARGAIDLLKPAGHIEPEPRARTAHFDVICSNPQCGRHFVIERKFAFRGFPVRCPFCGQETGQRALRCTSKACRGKLAATIEVDGKLYCAECGSPIDRHR